MTTENWMYGIKAASKYLLAILMIGVGTLHFVQPEFFVKIMPPYLPWHLELVYLSGVFEAALGLALLVPRTSRLAAWGIIALLIAVFPANIYLYQHQELLPASPMVHFLRLPLQAVFILWAYWHTKPSLEEKSESR
ncbi:DoxX family protein [Anatilimnocola aggregata]|nr:DoxX family protein [Anatilimnocola aggregata]